MRFEVITTAGRVFARTVPNSGTRDLEVGQQLQQEGLERFVGAVQFVDQQHGGRQIGVDRRQQRPGQQVFAV